MALDRETELRMEECFGGKTCCRCPQPAVRIVRHRFYCGDHFPASRSQGHAGHKVYKQPQFGKGPHKRA